MGALLRFVAPYLIAIAIAGGAYVWIVEHAKEQERNAIAAKAFRESENARKLREGNDADAHSNSDDDALRRLRDPTGHR